MAIIKERKTAGFTRVELVVVVVIGVLFVLWVMPKIFLKDGRTAKKRTCLNNLKQIGIAYRVFETDCNNLPPARLSVTNGGWSEYLTNGNAGLNCWRNFAAMHTELGEAPKVVVCPEDSRTPVTNFPSLGAFNNLNVSYFVGVGADSAHPQSILGGDRNLDNGTNTANYGFSPYDGKGNDVLISTNPRLSRLSWSVKSHTKSQTNKSGNLLLGDGSAQKANPTELARYRSSALDSGNFASNAVPKTPSFRLVFP